MSQRLHKSDLSVEEYLAGERAAAVRHEYVAGQVYARAGASARHNRISLNIASRLSDHIGDGPCDAFISDMKLYVAPNVFYYPDVMVTCDPPGGDAYFRSQPVLLIEVVSPSTERIDRREKLTAYSTIPSLQEYAIVQQDRWEVELHRRAGDAWQVESYSRPDEVVIFNSVELSLTVGDIYRHVRFETELAM